MDRSLLQLNIIAVVCACTITVTSLCEVRVPGQSWPTPKLPVPVNSTVRINCTTDMAYPHWSIDLPVADIAKSRLFVDFGGQKALLNNFSLYQLHSPEDIIEGELSTLRLLITNTKLNNQTVLKCIGDNRNILTTTLFVYEPSTLMIDVLDTETLQSVNVTWSSLPSLVDPKPTQKYTLTVKSRSFGVQTHQLYKQYYLFTAPVGAPPCEVYNFSVSATYGVIGATYTGDGCSEPGPVFSMMLPSRPNIAMLESSLSTALEIDPSGGVLLRVSFKPANYCEMYPVTGYTLEVEGPTSHLANTWRQSPNSNLKLELTVKSLKANQAYVFRVVASNSVGNVSTESKIIYTTDVSSIQAVPQKESNTFMIACTFISGSDARGCRVVLVGKFENVTANITRSSKCSSHTTILNATHPLTSYNEVYGYDIESDGSIGTLAVPGVITRNSDKISPCLPGELKPSPSHNILPFWSIGIILGVAVVTIAMILALVIYCLCKRCKTEKDTTFYHVTRPSAGPAPLTQPPVPTQDFTDDDEKMKQQPIYDLPVKKQEHYYHVLETSTRRYQFKPDDFHKGGNSHDTQESPSHSESADSSPGDPLPLYHEVAETPLVRERQKPRVATVGKNDHSSSSSQDDSMPPLYHEITNLSARGATSRLPV